MTNLIPDIYQKSIYTIDYNKLLENGIKCLLYDLDNTLVPQTEKVPSQKLKDFFDDLKDMGFRIIIFSNSPKKRVEPFKNTLLVDCCASARKPSKHKFLKVMKMFKLDLSEVAIIGDQLYTDILGGNRVGITTILVNPISPYDTLVTKLNRFRESFAYRKFLKRNILTKGKYYD